MNPSPSRRIKTSAAAAVIALMAAACGGSQADPTAATTEPADSASTTAKVASSSAPSVAEIISLGDREAGHGPGSAALLAGTIVARLGNLPGEWNPQFEEGAKYRPRPTACGFIEPVAVQVESFARANPADPPFGDVTSVEVFVYPNEEPVLRQVAALNGELADDCDLAIAEDANGPGNEVPGVTMDLSDAEGAPFDDHVDYPDSASRRYVGKISIGSEDRELEQIESAVAFGNVLVRTYAVSTHGVAEQVSIDTLEALLADGPVEAGSADENLAMDTAINDLRSAVLPDELFPDYFESAQRLKVYPPPPIEDSCFDSPGAIASTVGPSQLAVSPGIGASEVNQVSRVYQTKAQAEAAWADFAAKGAACYLETIGLLSDVFTETSSTDEILEVDGNEVVLLTSQLLQTIGTQEFEVEVGASAIQVGRYVLTLQFIGLTGDSPDLAALVANAADRITR